MDVKRIGNSLRFDPRVSHLAVTGLRPVQKICQFVEKQIRMKVWLNGGRVRYDGIELRFPQNVGVSYASGIFWNGLAGYEPTTWRALRIPGRKAYCS